MFKNFEVIIAKNQSEIQKAITSLKIDQPTAIVGFVPTMGALHSGHMSLINRAAKDCDIVVCSIFVNPTQFNNPEDLKTYPRTIAADQAMLEKNQCDLLLLPDFEAVYPIGIPNYSINLEGLDESMEGAYRPGHFRGVCMVVERFFEMVRPNKAYFGNKDFQQLSIIRKMVAIRSIKIDIVGVHIERAESGLALSSRNALLSPSQLKEAALIYRALKAGMLRYSETNNAAAIRSAIEACFVNSSIEVEYISFVDNDTLEEVKQINANSTVCIVAYCGSVRLIDNMQFSEA